MDPRAKLWIDQVIIGSPVARALGVELCSATVDEVVLRLPVTDHLSTLPGVVHGGVIATLIDITGAAGSASGIQPDDDVTGGATAKLSVSYLAPAGGPELSARGVVHCRTDVESETEVQVRDIDGTLVAKGLVSCRIFRNRS